MPVKVVHPTHIEIVGFGHVLIASPSPSSPVADLDMGQIAEEAALTSRAFAVIGKTRGGFSEASSPQSGNRGFRKGLEGFLVEDDIRYVLVIEGKSEPGVEIVMAVGRTFSESTLALVKSRLENQFIVKPSEVTRAATLSDLATSYSRKDPKGEFLVETIRVVFGGEEREFGKEKVISVISEIADLLNGRVGPSQPTNVDAAA